MSNKDFFKTAMFKDIVKPIVVLLAICIIIPLALSVTNGITADRITKLNEQNAKATMNKLLKADSFEELTFGKNEFVYYTGIKDDKTVGYIFTTSSKGYGGEVSVMTAVNTEGKILQVAILDATNETPGLGQNVTKESFYSQYENKIFGIEVKKNGAKEENNEINAVTGATISSKAVTTAVNDALNKFKQITEKAEEGQVESSEG